jgi:bacillithiol biosynthesis deacetylase BshB1
MVDLRYEDPEVSGLDVLALAAHPDDVEQTCGGTLLRMAEMGYRTGIVDLTAGEMGTRGTPETRLAEAEGAAKILKTLWRGNCRLPDARLENTLAARMTVSTVLRKLRPRTLILPYWEGRHPDHYCASQIGYEAAFLAGLRKMDKDTEPHRPFKVIYSSLYANVTPSFVVDITPYFERRMESLFAYQSQYGEHSAGGDLFPARAEIRDRLAGIARFYGNLIGAKYAEPFVVKEAIEIQDVVAFGPRSF